MCGVKLPTSSKTVVFFVRASHEKLSRVTEKYTNVNLFIHLLICVYIYAFIYFGREGRLSTMNFQ